MCNRETMCILINDHCYMDSPYKGHLGTRHLVLYKEVVLLFEVQNVLSKYEAFHLGPLNQTCP